MNPKEKLAALIKAARDGLLTMRLIGQTIPTSAYPSTLPRGSGNDCGSAYLSSRFYSGATEAEILAETTGAIGLEDHTDEVPPS